MIVGDQSDDAIGFSFPERLLSDRKIERCGGKWESFVLETCDGKTSAHPSDQRRNSYGPNYAGPKSSKSFYEHEAFPRHTVMLYLVPKQEEKKYT